jgi:hypothetical protein
MNEKLVRCQKAKRANDNGLMILEERNDCNVSLYLVIYIENSTRIATKSTSRYHLTVPRELAYPNPEN